MIADGRSRDAPPCDALAEALVLSRLITDPTLIDRYDIDPLLVFPEYRWCWQALRGVRSRYRGTDWDQFFRLWIEELDIVRPGKAWNLWFLIQHAIASEQARAWQLAGAGTPVYHGIDWWVARLQHVAESRQLISAAQQIAERGWVEDVDGATRIAAKAAGIGKSVRVDIDA